MKQDYLKPSTIKFACIGTIPLLLFFCVVSVVARAETHDIPKAKSSDEPITAGDWNQASFDAGHTGNNRYETLLSPDNVGNLTLLWASQGWGLSTTFRFASNFWRQSLHCQRRP